MYTLAFKRPVLSDTRPLAFVWTVGLVSAVLFGIPVAIFADSVPWLIAVPIGVGVVVVILGELFVVKKTAAPKLRRADFNDIIGKLGADLPSDHTGFDSFGSRVLFALSASEGREDRDQFELFPGIKGARPKPSQLKTARLVSLDQHGQTWVIESSRFAALLLEAVIPESDRCVEHALTMAFKRYSRTMVSEDLKDFMQDRGTLETIKSDFRGNLLVVLNRSTVRIVKDLIKKSQKENQKAV